MTVALLLVSWFGTPSSATELGNLIASQVSETTYRHYIEDLLYTHDGDSRGPGSPEHDLARANIVTAFEDLGLDVELHSFLYGGHTYYNVVATKTGTVYPDSYYVVGAHYDSVYNPGADDNASGVAGLLEIARVLSTSDTEYGIKFLAFDLEEWGLIGSQAYVQDHLSDDYVAMVQLDMIAWDSGGHVCEVDGSTLAEELVEPLAAALNQYAPGLHVSMDGPGAPSDQAPFAQAGIPACLLIEADYETNPCYHAQCDSVDTPDYLDYVLATDVVRGLAGFLADAASATLPLDCSTGEGCAVGVLGTEDCNTNGLWDGADIFCGFSDDENVNFIPDECEPHQTLYVDVANCPSNGTGTQGDPFCRIQDAIDAADDGVSQVVEILVADGTYTGPGNRALDFGGKRLTLRSQNGAENCVIDCESADRAFRFHSDETRGAVVEGLTVVNGWSSTVGGAVLVESCSATLRDCRFIDNHSETGGGAIRCSAGGSPLIEGCMFIGNTCASSGGAVYAYGRCCPVIECCTLADNFAHMSGGAIHASFSSLRIVDCRIVNNTASNGNGGGVYFNSTTTILDCLVAGNACGGNGGGISGNCSSGVTIGGCTISGNSAVYQGGGFDLGYGEGDVVSNCIHWGNSPSTMRVTGELSFAYCDIEGGQEGEGNIDADPLFVDPDGADDDPVSWEDNDHRLRVGSPCIDAGSNPAVPVDIWDADDDGDVSERIPVDLPGLARFVDDPMTPDTGLADAPAYPAVVDMGAYEYHPFEGLIGDLNCDDAIDTADIEPFALALLDTAAYAVAFPECGASLADCNADTHLDGRDIESFIALLVGE